MKIKHMMIVGLILAILTIGAVSASEDIGELAVAEDTIVDTSQVDDDEIIAGDESGDEDLTNIIENKENLASEVSAKDFEVNITKEINLDDENYSESELISIYVPENATNDIYIYLNDYDDYVGYINGWGSHNSTVTIKYGDLWRNPNIGDNRIKLIYDMYGDSFEVASGTFKVNKTIMIDDFAINCYNTVYHKNDEVFDIETIVKGNMTIYVDGNKRYSKYVEDIYAYIGVSLMEVGIVDEGTYEINVTFETEDTLLELTNYNLTYEYNDDHMIILNSIISTNNWDEIILIRDGYYDEEAGNYNGINGTVNIYINGKQVYNRVFDAKTGYDDLLLSSSDLNLTGITYGYYKLNVTYIKNNDRTYSTEKMVYFYTVPEIYHPRVISVGEKEGIIIIAPKGVSGVVSVYNAVKVIKEEEDGYYTIWEKDSLFATGKIEDGFGRVSLETLAEGNYSFFVEYTFGDLNKVNYNPYKIDVKNNTKGYESTISATTITAGDDVTVTLLGNASFKNAFVYVDGVEYTKMTFNLGEVISCVEGLTVGQHYITVKYRYTSHNITYSNTYVVTVKEKTAPENHDKPIKQDKITLTLKKVKIKKSAKKVVIQATLKINGKAVKGKTLKFKFNKKTFTAKTNKKGVAKITVKKSILKKLKVGKKVKYQVSYGKTVKKLSIKVKK